MTTQEIGWKLFKLRKNGTLGSLFFNARRELPTGEWMDAEDCHVKKGFAFRPGWHCCYQPVAPHLKKEGRIWKRVVMENYSHLERPESQGGAWCLAGRIMILEEEV